VNLNSNAFYSTFTYISSFLLLYNLLTVDLALDTTDISTGILIRPARALHIDILHRDVAAHLRTRAYEIPDERVVLLARRAAEVLDGNVGDGEVAGKLVAEGEVLLAVALGDFDGVVDVAKHHAVVSNVGDGTGAAAPLQVVGERGGDAWPDFDAGAVRGVGHADVVRVNVLHDVDFPEILAKAAHANAVAAVADEVLDNDVGAVRLEGDAVIAVIDV